MSGQQTLDRYRQDMFSTMNVGSMQAMGLAQAQSTNINNPYGMNYGAAAGMSPSYMMTSAQYGAFRPGQPAPPPALMSTPGVTSSFQNPADLAVQYQLMRTGMFADPGSAQENYGRMKLGQFGQKYGGGIGTAIGIGSQFIPGMQGIGGSLLGGLGSMAMENLNAIPGVGGALRWGIGALNQNVAEQLAWTGGTQHGTYGRVAMGQGEAGLGGRGMNMQAAMGLGRQMRQMSQETGHTGQAGAMNQADMLNLLRTAGDTGFLESSVNVDQIAKTVGGLMKLVGSLAKITGDPDFRNNLRELGQMRTMGLTTSQGVAALESMNTSARMAGLTRSELMETGALPGAMRSIAAGLTGAVGFKAGATAKGEERMLKGLFSETQQSLMGDMSQIIAEGKVGFSAGVTPFMIPSLLSATGGFEGGVGLDKSKIEKLLKGGPIDMTQLAGEGQYNLQKVAAEHAKNRAKREGRAEQSGDYGDAIIEITSNMKERQSELAQQLTDRQMEMLRYKMFQGEQAKGIGTYAAAMMVAGNNEKEANILLKMWQSPKYADRIKAFEEQEAEGKHAALTQERKAFIAEAVESADIGRSPILSMFRSVKKWWQEPMRMSVRDLEKADDELRQIQQDTDEVKGINRIPIVGPMSYATDSLKKKIRAAQKTGGWKSRAVRNYRTGDQPLSEEEARVSSQLLGESESYGLSAQLVGDVGGTRHLDTFMGQVKMYMEHPTMALMKHEDLTPEQVKKAIESRRQLISDLDYTADAVEKSASMTDSQYLAASKNLATAITGKPGMGPPAQVLNTVKTEMLALASKRGKDGAGVTVGNLRTFLVDAFTKQMGNDRDAANKYVNSLPGINTWISKTVFDEGDANAKKALNITASVAGVRELFHIGKTTEELKKAEQEAADKLGATGVFLGQPTQSDTNLGGTDVRPKFKFGADERGATETLISGAGKIGEEAFGEGQEGKGGMIALLVAQKEYGTKEEKDRAGTMLENMQLGPDGAKVKKAISDIKAKITSGEKAQGEVLSRYSSLFAKAGVGETAEVYEKRFQESYDAAIAGKGPGSALMDLYKAMPTETEAAAKAKEVEATNFEKASSTEKTNLILKKADKLLDSFGQMTQVVIENAGGAGRMA